MNTENSRVLNTYFRAVQNRNDRKLLAVLHPNATFEFPYALPGSPKEINSSFSIRDFLLQRKFLSNYRELQEIDETNNGLVVIEVESEETFPQSRRSCLQHLICKVGIKEGKIFYYKEFFNPLIRLECLLDLASPDIDLEF